MCSIDSLEGCSLADLEVMYVDALWTYYQKGEFTLTDDQYDRLKDELNWQGSGFPTLKRFEVKFVEASIAYARGEPIVSDEEYEDLKAQVKANGKRSDVTALLLYAKGQQLLDADQYEALSDEMFKLGIEVGLRGATCTLSTTSDDLRSCPEQVASMYAGLAIIPSLICFLPYVVSEWIFNGLPAATALLPIAAGVALTAILVRYLNLHNTQIVTGQCPCCESELKQLFAGDEPPATADQKCPVCGTSVSMSRTEMKLTLASGPSFVGTEA